MADFSIDWLAKRIRKRVRNDWDCLIAITGSEGTGKSTLGILLSQAIDRGFKFEKNMSFYPDPVKIVDEFNRLRKYQVYILDEAINVMFKQDWQSKLQKVLIKMYATERWQNKVTVLCIPRFLDLAAHFRQYRVHIWIHVYKRGHAFVYMKSQDKDTEDPWFIDAARKIKKKSFGTSKLVKISMDNLIKIERRLPTYLADFEFPDLDEETKKEYIALKIGSRSGVDAEEKLGFLEKKYKGALQKLIVAMPQVPATEIARLVGMDSDTIGRLRKGAVPPQGGNNKTI